MTSPGVTRRPREAVHSAVSTPPELPGKRLKTVPDTGLKIAGAVLGEQEAVENTVDGLAHFVQASR